MRDGDQRVTKLAYLTFGKGSRLGELFVGSLVLGGASKIGTVPDGISGAMGIVVCGLCFVGVCWLGVSTGQLTISPTLNTWWKVMIISVIQFLFIAAAVSVAGVLRTSVTIVVAQITSVSVREIALVSLLTLGYVLTVNRTSELTADQRTARKQLTDLHEEMRKMREQENSTPDPDQMITNLKEVAEKIPRSQFDDVNELKSELKSIATSLEKLDHDSREQIITGSIPPETQRGESYQEALTIYNSVYNIVGKVKTDVRIH